MPERLDTSEMPLTEPHAAPIFDTGPHPEPIASSVDVLDVDSQAFSHELESELGADSAFEWPDVDAGPQVVPAAPAEARNEYQYVQWWKFLLLTLGVWTVAAGIGLGLYYWWFHATDKTWTDFTVLVYVVVCIVAALLVSMVERRPLVATTAVALMSSPFASGVAAAVLYGLYVSGTIKP